jgi:hypothetical protein
MNSIFVIGCLDALQNRMDKNLYNFYIYLQKSSKYSIFLICVSEKRKIQKILNMDNNSNIILLLPGCTLDNINLFKGIKIYLMEDIRCRCRKYICSGGNGCQSNQLVEYLKQHNFSYLFYRYDTYIFRQNYSFVPNKYHFPHFIDSNINKDYELEKKYDLLIYGNCSYRYYPFRSRLKSILQQQSIFNVFFIDYSEPITGEELSKKINESWLTICTKSYNDLLLQKYIEIPMCKSVICGDFPDLEERVFGENMVYINYSMRDDEIITIIKSALADKEKLRQLAENSYKIAMEKYTYEKGLETFEKYLDDIVGIESKKIE